MVAMMALLATATGAIVGGVGALLSDAINSRTSPGGQTAMNAMQQQFQGLFPQSGALLPPTGRTANEQVPGNLTALAQQDGDLALALGRMEQHGGAAQDAQDRDQVTNLLVTKHHMNQQEAANLVNQWDQQFRQVHAQAAQQTREAGQAAARGLEDAAWWGFGALILGLALAAWGGWVGTASLRRTAEVTPVVT